MQHPEISWMERTGYPSYAQPENVFCEYCGRDITDDDVYFDEDHSCLCESCLLDFHKKEW